MRLRVYTLSILLMLSSFSTLSQQFDDSLEDDFEQLDALLDSKFRETDESLEKKFLQVQQAVDAAYKGLTKKIEVNWKSDIKLPEKSSWVTYDETFTSRGEFDFDKGVYQVETLVGNDVADSLLKLKAVAVALATSSQQELKSKDVFNQAVNQQLNKSFDLASSLMQESNSIQHINVMQILPLNTESLITQVGIDNIEMQPPEMTSKQPIAFKNRTTEKESITTISPSQDTVQQAKIPEIIPALIVKQTDAIERQIMTPEVEPALIAKQTDAIEQQTMAPDVVPALIAKQTIAIKQQTMAPEVLPALIVKQTIAIKQQTMTPEVLPALIVKQTNAIKQQAMIPKVVPALIVTQTNAIKQQTMTPKVIPTLTLEETGDIRKLVLTIPFVNNFQKVLMESRLDTVKTVAKRFNIEASLILAVIETESSFNPRATSPIPAFGLMQLVPKTAGIDSYTFVHGYQKVVSPEYLYNQENNLLLGTAYLHLLANRYLRNINDEQSKLYCMLASYNTGVGNLAKTLINKKNLGKAVLKVNSMTSEQVYKHLMKHLPADETKNYLIKILRRKQKYLHLDQI